METDEELATGYGPSSPAGDNLCNDYSEGLVAGYTALAEARGDVVLVDDELALTDGGSPSPFVNMAVVRRPLTAEEWRPAVERMHAFYAGRPGGPFLVFSAWPTPDLVPSDFGRIGHPPLMFRPAPPIPAAPIPAAPIPGFEIRPVTDAGTARDWEATLVEGFPLAELAAAGPGCVLPPGAVHAGPWRHWVGYLDGRPVATSSANVGPHHVDVEFVSTLEAARGKGIGRAITSAATNAETDRPALLIASDMGQPVYERMGYIRLLRFTLWAGHRRA